MDSQIKSLIYIFLKQGLTFKKIVKKLMLSQYYSTEQLEEIQNGKLRKMIEHCYKNVPYYTELFNQLKLKPEDIQTKEDLNKLPYMDKYVVRANFEKLIARNTPRIFSSVAETSGTTGTPSKFLRDYRSINFESAALWRFRDAVGGNGARRVVLRGDVVVPVDRDVPPFWKHYPFNNELYMSSYHISSENAGIYLKKMKEFKAETIYGFPSSVYLLAKYFNDMGRKFQLKAVFTSSETISDKQRALIESVFMCRIYDWYGQVERISAIGQCEKGTYHIIEDYSITETIDTGNGLEIVGTDLNNYTMPLLRFRTADIVELGHEKCSCGRNFRVISRILGRNLHYIISPEGKKISLFLISDSIDFDNNINEVQFIHEQKGEIILNIVKNEKYTEKDAAVIVKKIKERTSPNMLVKINEVEKIPRGPNGKAVDSIIKQFDV